MRVGGGRGRSAVVIVPLDYLRILLEGEVREDMWLKMVAMADKMWRVIMVLVMFSHRFIQRKERKTNLGNLPNTESVSTITNGLSQEIVPWSSRRKQALALHGTIPKFEDKLGEPSGLEFRDC